MKKLFIPILFFLLSVKGFSQDKKVNWLKIEEAVALNKQNPKPFLIDIYTDWCGWCKKMDQTTYQNDVLAAYINKNFHAVKLNGEQKEAIVFEDYTFSFKPNGRGGYNEFAAVLLNGKLSYPTTVFLNKELQLLDRVPGYLDEKIMEQVTSYFAQEKYKTEQWEDFAKKFKSSL